MPERIVEGDQQEPCHGHGEGDLGQMRAQGRHVGRIVLVGHHMAVLVDAVAQAEPDGGEGHQGDDDDAGAEDKVPAVELQRLIEIGLGLGAST